MKIIAFLFSFLLFFGFAVQAVPILFDITPANNSYTYGKDTDIFSTKISESNLNVSSAYLHIRVQDPTSIWSNISMSSNCANTSTSDWGCNTTVTGLSALAGDGNTLLYYFDAYDNSGIYGSNGTTDGSNRVKIDRRGPTINFTNPINQSYIGGNNVSIKISVIDEFSGVNASAVNYSFDNSTWLSTSQNVNIFSSLQTWDTTTYSNNQTVTIYVKAADIIGNVNYKYINVVIDNEIPRLIILTPASNQILNGTVTLSFIAEDTYSGLDNSTAAFTLTGPNTSLSCTGTSYSINCSTNFVTTSVADSPYNLTYSIKDKAGNLAQNNTSIIIDNQPPVISITSPTNNAEVNGIVSVSATVTDSGIGVHNVSFRWENTSSGNWTLLNCSGSLRSFSCSASWDTTNISIGIYTIRFRAFDGTLKQTISGVTVKVKSPANSTTTTIITGSTTTLATTTTQSTTTSTTSTAISQYTKIEKFMKSRWMIAVILTLIAAILFVYFFWPKKESAYPGYKPK